MKASRRAAVLAFLVCILAAVNISAATLVVTKTEDTNDGICDADCSLREAAAVAAADDTVVFSSLFNTAQTITLTLGQIVITRNLTIMGTGSELLAISGNNASRIFGVGASVLTLSGMTVRDGRVTEMVAAGGGISVDTGALNLTSVVMTNNYAFNQSLGLGYGGAIYCRNGVLNVTSSSIRLNNSATNAAIFVSGSTSTVVNISNSDIRDNTGGGIYGDSNSYQVNITGSIIDNNSRAGVSVVGPVRLHIIGTTISNNRAGGVLGVFSDVQMTIEYSAISGNTRVNGPNLDSGGIRNDGTAYIRQCTIANNRASGKGGGIDNGGTMYLENTSVVGNQAQLSGGGALNVIGTLFTTNSTFSGNTANQLGGGIYNLVNQSNPNGAIVSTNSTFAFNTAGQGGGIQLDSKGTATFRNSIVANNTSTGDGPNVFGNVVSEGHNLISSIAGSIGWSELDILGVNPLLAPLGSNGGATMTHALQPSSPAIDHGNRELARDPLTGKYLMLDQRGFERNVGMSVDIGAHESNISGSAVNLSGRILTTGGRGLAGALIRLTSETGVTTYTVSNPFGYYRFLNLTPGTTFTVSVTRKFYSFSSPQITTLEQNRTDFDFVGLL